MAQDSEIRRVLREHLHDPSSSFSIGSFGAIAEFHRAPGEPLVLDEPNELTIATERGGLRIELADRVTPLAYEMLSRRPDRWQQGVVFCLPEPTAASRARSALTELGPDAGALRPRDRAAILFDMGLSARNVDFCIRTEDPGLEALLRRHCGRSLLEPSNPAMGAILEASPHRIALSRLGRVEVYQAIGKVKTPEGPHTHVLPKFLRSGRTHSANIPVPRDQLPCLSLYPANPLVDGLGRSKPFDPSAFAAFEALLKLWAPPAYLKEKTRAMRAFRDGRDPVAYPPPQTRLGRTALRVGLRQARQTDGENPALQAWRRHFDAPAEKQQAGGSA